MKRFAIILALILCMAFLFVGCSDGADATVDQVATEFSGDDAPMMLTVTLDAFTYNGIEHQFTLEYGEGKTAIEEMFNNLTFTASEGDTVEQVINNADYYNLKVLETHDKFLGWMEYKILTEDDGTVIYEKTSDTLYTTQEVMEKTMADCPITYVARWEKLDDDYYAAYGF